MNRSKEKHLFLTSNGLTDSMKRKLFSLIGKTPEGVKVLYIPTAGIETDGAREGFAVCLHELAAMGILPEHILVYNLELIVSQDYTRTYSAYIQELPMVSRLLTPEELECFDMVFVSGGDCAVLCREMKRTGFDQVLREAISHGVIYVGISAGSMYAAGNLEDGLRILPHVLTPHWTGEAMEGLPDGAEEIRLKDGQAVYVAGNGAGLLK